MRNFIEKHASTFLGLGITLMLIGWMSGARAQDAIDQQQNLDIATVNSKAEDARGKALGLEQRVTIAEGTLTTHGSDVASVATQLGNVDARVSALEAAPSANQAQVDALAARVATLEAAPPATPLRFVVRDALGELVGQWASRSEVGQGVMAFTFGDVAYTVTVDALYWELDPRIVYYANSAGCNASDVEQSYRRTKDVHGNPYALPESPSFTGIKDGYVQDFLGVPHVWVPDYAAEFYVGSATQYYFRNANGDCGPLNLAGYFAPFTPIGPLPVFQPPFTMTEE